MVDFPASYVSLQECTPDPFTTRFRFGISFFAVSFLGKSGGIFPGYVGAKSLKDFLRVFVWKKPGSSKFWDEDGEGQLDESVVKEAVSSWDSEESMDQGCWKTYIYIYAYIYIPLKTNMTMESQHY